MYSVIIMLLVIDIGNTNIKFGLFEGEELKMLARVSTDKKKTSDEFAGIDSKILLARVMELIRGKGWSVGNVDITIAMQRPKLAPRIMAMRECMASVMNIPVECVSVKATTTEKLGFVGRGEGCEVYAVALLKK